MKLEVVWCPPGVKLEVVWWRFGNDCQPVSAAPLPRNYPTGCATSVGAALAEAERVGTVDPNSKHPSTPHA